MKGFVVGGVGEFNGTVIDECLSGCSCKSRVAASDVFVKFWPLGILCEGDPWHALAAGKNFAMGRSTL